MYWIFQRPHYLRGILGPPGILEELKAIMQHDHTQFTRLTNYKVVIRTQAQFD